MRKITTKITEKSHGIFDMQRRIITKITKITSKIHTNKKKIIYHDLSQQEKNVTYVLDIIYDYCDYSVTDSDFVCDFSVICV